MTATDTDRRWMRRALSLARRAEGRTSPNPLVGAVLVRRGKCLGEGWHRRAGMPHAEIEALSHCRNRGLDPSGATLYVTLEPCSTHGRTPPCTQALISARIQRVVVAATDPNPDHAGRGLVLLRQAGIHVDSGVLAEAASDLNSPFNHWIVHRTPLVTLKAALTLDGRIATATGESRWITGPKSRLHTMRLRRRHDAILVGVNTVIQDDPQLTARLGTQCICPWRVVLDSRARTPLSSTLATDEYALRTLIVVSPRAPGSRVRALEKRVEVIQAQADADGINLPWLVRELGRRQITGLLVEGGGEVHASFLRRSQAHRIAFFLAPAVLGGRNAIRAVGGSGFTDLPSAPRLRNLQYRRLDGDLLLTAEIIRGASQGP